MIGLIGGLVSYCPIQESQQLQHALWRVGLPFFFPSLTYAVNKSRIVRIVLVMPAGGQPCSLSLRESHFIPAALYPRARKPSFASRNRRLVALDSKDRHIKDYVLCFDCEQRFDRNGESEVLYWVSPKSKTFHLGERLKIALPRDYDQSDPDQSINRYSGTDIGVDLDKFAYFAISIFWRGAAHDWVLPDGSVRHTTHWVVSSSRCVCICWDRLSSRRTVP